MHSFTIKTERENMSLKSTYNKKDIYEFYSGTLEGTIDRKTFHNLCKDFNSAVMDEIIVEGKEFNQGYNLSSISILRLERDWSKKQIDWEASKKYRQELLGEGKELYNSDTDEGEKWFIYHTDKWYCRFYWKKKICSVPNKSVYRFKPTGGKRGNKTKLKEHMKKDDLAYTKYDKQ